MSRNFLGTSNEYLQAAFTDPGYPMTMACWFNTSDAANRQTPLGIGDANGDYVRQIHLNYGPSPSVIVYEYGIGGFKFATSTNTFAANVWAHAVAVFAAHNDRRIYVNGGGRVDDNASTDSDDGSIDQVNIGKSSGVRRTLDYFDDRVAEAAIWNVALTDTEVAILAAGYSPLFVRPQNLLPYWPLIRDEDQDRTGDYDLAAFNTPTIAAHPPVIYPAPPGFYAPTPAAPAGWHRHMSMTGVSARLG